MLLHYLPKSDLYFVEHFGRKPFLQCVFGLFDDLLFYLFRDYERVVLVVRIVGVGYLLNRLKNEHLLVLKK